MKKVFMALVIVAIGWFLYDLISSKIMPRTQYNRTETEKPYDTPLFSVQFPAGAHIERETKHSTDSTDSASYSTSTYYSGNMPGRGWATVTITDFSEARDRASVINAMSEVYSTSFKPGFLSSPITDTTLGGLPAKEQMFHGEMANGGIHLTVRFRVAFSPDAMRSWTIITSFDDERNPLPEADCESFFNSLKIK